jgi:hypothetical protein
MSPNGPNANSSNVRFPAALGGRADIRQASRNHPQADVSGDRTVASPCVASALSVRPAGRSFRRDAALLRCVGTLLNSVASSLLGAADAPKRLHQEGARCSSFYPMCRWRYVASCANITEV